MVESWMVSAIIAITGVIATYATTRTTLSKQVEDFKDHLKDDSTYHRDMDQKLNAQFKRIDDLTNRCTVLEQENKALLDLATAEAKFVSRKEFDLHLKTIEYVSKNTQKSVERVEGKLEDIADAINTLSNKR